MPQLNVNGGKEKKRIFYLTINCLDKKRNYYRLNKFRSFDEIIIMMMEIHHVQKKAKALSTSSLWTKWIMYLRMYM